MPTRQITINGISVTVTGSQESIEATEQRLIKITGKPPESQEHRSAPPLSDEEIDTAWTIYQECKAGGWSRAMYIAKISRELECAPSRAAKMIKRGREKYGVG